MTASHAIYAQVEARFACDHSRQEVRRQIASSGRTQYREQCVRCGRVSHCLPVASILPKTGMFPEDLDPIDETLSRRWWQARVAYGQQLRDEARLQDDEAWWDRYNAYLDSPAWRTRRARVLERDRHICQAALDGCAGRATQVHHLSYRHLGQEPLWELQSICPPCHEAITEADRAARGAA